MKVTITLIPPVEVAPVSPNARLWELYSKSAARMTTAAEEAELDALCDRLEREHVA